MSSPGHLQADISTIANGAPSAGVFSHTGTRIGLLAFIAFALLAGFNQLPTRDTWMDEVWSMFLSDPSIPFGSLIFERWAYDIHPPLFMFMARLYRSLMADEIVAARTLNLVVLAPALVYLISLWHRAPAMQALLAMFTPIFFSGMFFVHYAAEFRVYFTLILVSAMYALSSYRVITTTLLNQPIPAQDYAVMMVCAFLLMSLHILAMPFVLIHASLLAMLFWHQGAMPKLLELRGFWTVIGVALVSLACFYLFVEDFQHGTTAGGSWIAAVSLPQAIIRILKLSAKMAPGIVAILLIAAAPMLTRGRAQVIEPKHHEAHRAEQIWLLSMGLALCGFVAMMLCANLKTPLMVDRYFAVMTGPLAAVIAVMASRPLLQLTPALQVTVLIATLASSAAITVRHVAIEDTSWNQGLYYSESLNRARELNARCNRPILHATDNRLRYAVYQEQLGDWVARYLAPKLGVAMQAAGPDTPIRATPACPVALWLPFLSRAGAPGTIESVLEEHRLVLDGVSIDQLEIELHDSTAIVRLKR